jgi:hypothetical protein
MLSKYYTPLAAGKAGEILPDRKNAAEHVGWLFDVKIRKHDLAQ